MEGSISHVSEDESSILVGMVNMRSLAALERWKHQQLETLVEWQLGRVSQDEFMKPSQLSHCISSKWQAQSHPSLPASTSAIPFHHIPALQVWWQTSTLKATLHKSVFKNVRLKTWNRERGSQGFFVFFPHQKTRCIFLLSWIHQLGWVISSWPQVDGDELCMLHSMCMQFNSLRDLAESQ